MARKPTQFEQALLAQIEQLTHQLAALAGTIEGLTERIEQLQRENSRLRDQLEQAQQAAARQAAPFRRRQAKKKDDADKKPPGRSVGHVGTARRKPPQIDEHHEVRLEGCPHCGGPVTDARPIVQYIEEIPPIRPVVHRVTTYEGQCPCCGTVRSRHPLQTSERPGVQLGPRAAAVAVALNKQLGLTMRKTCRVLRELLGLGLSPGGLSQLADRLADRAAGAHERLVQDIRGAPACNADETSWWVGGPGWWLWTFTTPEATLYRVEKGRGSSVVLDTLGPDYAGVLGSDCLNSYDPIDCRKHKCIAHHLRAIAEARQMPGQDDGVYLRQWTILLKMTVLFHRLAVEGVIGPAELAQKRAHLEQWADTLLAQPVGGTGDARIKNRLAKQRRHLLTCLYELSADPTNNAAERALRPAVIARKLSCGNRTVRGKQTWEILASLAQTCHQRGHSFIHFLTAHASTNPAAR